MSSKTRKFIGPMSLVAIFAVVGALAAFVVLAVPNANPAEAQFETPVPGAPATVTATAGNTEIVVAWTPPSDTTIPVDTYTVQWKVATADDDTYVSSETGPSYARLYPIPDLINGTAYIVRVFASNAGGDGAPLAVAAVTPKPTIPDPPTGVTVTQTSEVGAGTDGTLGTADDTAGADVSWVAPENNGGSDIIGYVVEVDDDGGTPFAPAANWGTAVLLASLIETQAGFSLSTKEAVTALQNGATVRVTAINSSTLITALGVSLIQDDLTAAIASQSDLATFAIQEAPDIADLDFEGTIESDEDSGGGAPQFTVTIPSLTTALPVGSSIVLYLEDDYQEPDSIPASSVYFVADESRTEPTGNGARVYATRASSIETDDYFDPTKNDISVVVQRFCQVKRKAILSVLSG